MKDRHEHITPEFLTAVAERSVPLAELLLRVYDHLLSVCPECAWSVARYTATQGIADPEMDPLTFVNFHRLVQRVETEQEHVSALRVRAQRELKELLAFEPELRFATIREGGGTFRNPALAQLLVAESHRTIIASPREAEHLARLAEEVALGLTPDCCSPDLARDLQLQAQAHQANALRAAEELVQAERTMETVLEHYRESADPLIRGELLFLAACLYRDQRRFQQAMGFLDRAALVYRRVGDTHRVGKMVLTQATVWEAMGEPEQAIDSLRKATELLDPERDLYLQLCAYHNLAWYLTCLHRFTEAAEVYKGCREIYEDFHGYRVQLRRRWLEARIAYGTNDPDDPGGGEAEAGFLDVRAGFLAEGLTYDAALVGLDLALLYVRQGHHAEVRSLAEEMFTTFRAHGIQREALASLKLLQQATAAEAQETTLGLIRDLSAYLEKARGNPGLEFESMGHSR